MGKLVKNSGDGVVLMTQKDVPNAIKKLKEQLAQLKKEGPEDLSLDIEYENGMTSINIKDVDTVGELLKISSSIHARAKAYDEEISRYKLDKASIKAFTVTNKSVDQWFAIINKAIYEVINKSKIQKLESAISKLSQHLDAETRLKNEFESIMDMATKEID